MAYLILLILVSVVFFAIYKLIRKLRNALKRLQITYVLSSNYRKIENLKIDAISGKYEIQVAKIELHSIWRPLTIEIDSVRIRIAKTNSPNQKQKSTLLSKIEKSLNDASAIKFSIKKIARDFFVNIFKDLVVVKLLRRIKLRINEFNLVICEKNGDERLRLQCDTIDIELNEGLQTNKLKLNGHIDVVELNYKNGTSFTTSQIEVSVKETRSNSITTEIMVHDVLLKAVDRIEVSATSVKCGFFIDERRFDAVSNVLLYATVDKLAIYDTILEKYVFGESVHDMSALQFVIVKHSGESKFILKMNLDNLDLNLNEITELVAELMKKTKKDEKIDKKDEIKEKTDKNNESLAKKQHFKKLAENYLKSFQVELRNLSVKEAVKKRVSTHNSLLMHSFTLSLHHFYVNIGLSERNFVIAANRLLLQNRRVDKFKMHSAKIRFESRLNVIYADMGPVFILDLGLNEISYLKSFAKSLKQNLNKEKITKPEKTEEAAASQKSKIPIDFTTLQYQINLENINYYTNLDSLSLLFNFKRLNLSIYHDKHDFRFSLSSLRFNKEIRKGTNNFVSFLSFSTIELVKDLISTHNNSYVASISGLTLNIDFYHIILFIDSIYKLTKMLPKSEEKNANTIEKKSKFHNKKLRIYFKDEAVANILLKLNEDKALSPHPTLKDKVYLRIRIVGLALFFNSDKYFKAKASNAWLEIDEKSLVEHREGVPAHKNRIITAEKATIAYIFNKSILQCEREKLSLPTTGAKMRSLLLKCDTFRLFFRFGIQYCILLDHFYDMRKITYTFLRQLRNSTSPPGYNPNRKPIDIAIRLNEFRFIIEDDPFEVKLMYNYSLQLDEYNESVKRRQALNARLQLKDSMKWENMANDLLREKEAQIYIKRARKLYENSQNIRSELFTIAFTNVDLHLVDNEALNANKTDLVAMINKIDPTSKVSVNKTFSILHYRHIGFKVSCGKLLLRDYPEAYIETHDFFAWGDLLIAEFEAVPLAARDVQIEFEDSDLVLKATRNMMPVKYYHDLRAKVRTLSYSNGPNFESALAQFNLSLDKILHPSRDPSPALPWWDKTRLIYHGRFTASVDKFQIIYHLSLDPYNRTEEMKWQWEHMYFDWTNQRFILRGDSDIFLNTASKYDDCNLFHFPQVDFQFDLAWFCKDRRNNPNDHNSVFLCSAKKLTSTENHDSYAKFRTEGVEFSFHLICKNLPKIDDEDLVPKCQLYGSTLRLLQKFKELQSRGTRLTRRGKLFGNVKPRKKALGRHISVVRFHAEFPLMNIHYWSSASEQFGIQAELSSFTHHSRHNLDLIKFNDGLKRRPAAHWDTKFMNCKLSETFIYLMSPASFRELNKGAKNGSDSTTSSSNYEGDFLAAVDNERAIKSLNSKPSMRNFLLMFDSFVYDRENNCITVPKLNSGTLRLNVSTIDKNTDNSAFLSRNLAYLSSAALSVDDRSLIKAPLHKIHVNNLKAKWNNINRDVFYTLFEIYNKAKMLRHNLSSQALKQFMFQETSEMLEEEINQSNETQRLNSEKSSHFSQPYSKDLFTRLENEQSYNFEIECDDEVKTSTDFNELLYGVHLATKMDDIGMEDVRVEFMNSQIKMSVEEMREIGHHSSDEAASLNTDLSIDEDEMRPEPKEYLIISAAKATVKHRIHHSVKNAQRYLNKFSWVGNLESMQYFATLKEASDGEVGKNKTPRSYGRFTEYWLDDKMVDKFTNLQLGDVVKDPHSDVRIQLIVSRCRCEFYMVDFKDKIFSTEMDIERNLMFSTRPKNKKTYPKEIDMKANLKEPFDSFTLIHYDLKMRTDAAQYKLILDMVNNLVLYFRPRRKQVLDRQKSIKFNWQLTGDIFQFKQMIQQKQSDIKDLLCRLRLLERKLFHLQSSFQSDCHLNASQRSSIQSSELNVLKCEIEAMENEYRDSKRLCNEQSAELNLLVNCYNELILEKRAEHLHRVSKLTAFTHAPLEQRSSIEAFIEYERRGDKSKQVKDIDKFEFNKDLSRRYEVWFKETDWQLSEANSAFAQLKINNFFYTKFTNQHKHDCIDHNLEISACHVVDLVPDWDIYHDVLQPMHSEFNTPGLAMVRIFCKQKPPVTGIQVIEHLELNIAPIQIQLTNKFYHKMMKYFFKDNSSGSGVAVLDGVNSNVVKNEKKEGPKRSSSFNSFINEDGQLNKIESVAKQMKSYESTSAVKILAADTRSMATNGGGSYNGILEQDKAEPSAIVTYELKNGDIEIMKQRSAKNNTFICVKIPKIPLIVSYKGNKDKNIEDLHDVALMFPDFELNNKVLTWLDLVNSLKTYVKKKLVPQALKYKLLPKIHSKPMKRLNKKIEENKTINELLGSRFIAKKSTQANLNESANNQSPAKHAKK